jgi:hypothetical protein
VVLSLRVEMSLKMRAVLPLETLGYDYPLTQRYAPEEQNP